MSASPASNWPCHQSLECRNLHLQPHHTLGCTDSFISFQQHLSTQNLFAEWNIFFNTWCLLWPKPWIFQISLLWIQHKNESPQDQKGAWTKLHLHGSWQMEARNSFPHQQELITYGHCTPLQPKDTLKQTTVEFGSLWAARPVCPVVYLSMAWTLGNEVCALEWFLSDSCLLL